MAIKEKIAVILPTYNEKGNIVKLIDAIHAELKEYDHSIVVVDDNSPDGTYQTVLDLNYSYAQAILRKENRGLANSIRCGLENVEADVFVVMDTDFNHQPKYIPFMLESLTYYDCVIASRFLYGGRMINAFRHYLSWLFNLFIRVATGGLISDSLYGFFAIKRDVLERFDYDEIFWGYGDYFTRMLCYMQMNTVNILQFPAVNGKRQAGEGNSQLVRVFKQYFGEVLKLAYKVHIKKINGLRKSEQQTGEASHKSYSKV